MAGIKSRKRWWEKRGLRSDPRKQCINCAILYIPPKDYIGYYCPECKEHWDEHGRHRDVDQ